MTATPTRSDAVLERLLALHPKLVDLSLGRIERLLGLLGHPEAKLAPVVHVTGTNGKGSLVAFLRSSLSAAGYTPHVYTSPHLVRFAERIRVAGEIIGEAELTALLEECERVNGGTEITFFEITTAAALLAFSRHPADVVLLENGLGGRLDATNVVERPALTAITPVSMDHQQFLGDTIEKIAFEKAGILKRGVPCVLGPQPPAVLDVIEARAAELRVPLWREGQDWRWQTTGEGGIVVDTPKGRLEGPPPALPGPHQLTNAATALACIKALGGFEVPAEAIRRGLTEIEWPARLQRLTRGPLPESLPAGWELWLDGGHNPDAGRAIAGHVRNAWTERPLHLVCGMLESKEPRGFLEPLAPLVRSLHAVEIPNEKATFKTATLLDVARKAGHHAAAADSVAAALAAIRAEAAPEPARVLICGSLYLAGYVLHDNG